VTCAGCGGELVALPASPDTGDAQPRVSGTAGSSSRVGAAPGEGTRLDKPAVPHARKCPHCQESLGTVPIPVAEPAPRRSPLAVAAFLLAVTSPFFLCLTAPVAAALGVAALLDHTAAGKGRGMAITALALGMVWSVAFLLLVLLTFGGLAAIALGPSVSSYPTEPVF